MSTRPTEAQDRARQRNWRIRSLRALWAQAGMLSPDRAAAVRHIVDAELQAAGAEPELIRRERYVTESEIHF
ncbi:hypothetical protein LZK98_11720 [Sphingomonas cannabina]|uniref:hypothetical protein n=1 Tax=Sphingomonas cannabina TaxID=2899123 RepID=UPI001F313421|nr:hypothetical protein [Sphingomonas cannabina]UIJ43759.1 hypothetical protein LZK98_11720 [Sphingomonas cannabina]